LPPTPAAAASPAPLLDERYGRTPARRRRLRVIAWSAAAAFVVVLVSWVVWGGLDGTARSVDVLDTGYRFVDDRAVEVAWQLTVEPGRTSSCAVQAQNAQHAIVGWKVVEIEASDRRTRAFRELVKTSEPADTGLIYRCWLT